MQTSETDTPQSSGRKKYHVMKDTQLSARMKLLLEKLNRFYQNGEFEKTVIPIIRDKKPLAVRDIDWLVTNYSKAFPVVYPNPMKPMGEPFNVHESYEQHELVWKKGLFDPFQRGPRIHYEANGEQFVTTIAQLNFFCWAIQHGVIDWAARHKDKIKKHHQTIKDARKKLIKEQPNREKKRMRLTPVDNSHCLVYVQPMRIPLGPQKKNRADTGDMGDAEQGDEKRLKNAE